jgi:hypothetical protein
LVRALGRRRDEGKTKAGGTMGTMLLMLFLLKESMRCSKEARWERIRWMTMR